MANGWKTLENIARTGQVIGGEIKDAQKRQADFEKNQADRSLRKQEMDYKATRLEVEKAKLENEKAKGGQRVEKAQYFARSIEDMVNEIPEEMRPQAQTFLKQANDAAKLGLPDEGKIAYQKVVSMYTEAKTGQSIASQEAQLVALRTQISSEESPEKREALKAQHKKLKNALGEFYEMKRASQTVMMSMGALTAQAYQAATNGEATEEQLALVQQWADKQHDTDMTNIDVMMGLMGGIPMTDISRDFETNKKSRKANVDKFMQAITNKNNSAKAKRQGSGTLNTPNRPPQPSEVTNALQDALKFATPPKE